MNPSNGLRMTSSVSILNLLYLLRANGVVEIQYCGICGTDLHTMSNGWGNVGNLFPQVVGHEIVGKVVRVGKDVKHLKEGDIAGVGAQCDSCLACDMCEKGELYPRAS